VLFTGIALKSPQSFAWFTTEYFTAGLAALMLSMGITLTPADFAKVAKRPNATIMQFALCYAVMPVLALALGTAFGLDKALIAGMVLVGSINGGQASNLCTYIARGNVALSVLMTTATTIGAIFMTPLLCKTILGAVVPVDAIGIAKSTVEVRTSICCCCLLKWLDVIASLWRKCLDAAIPSNTFLLNLLFFKNIHRLFWLQLRWACP
jgi:bile acid:Na+ symporter, BASS family